MRIFKIRRPKIHSGIEADYLLSHIPADIVSRFLMNWGSKLELRSRGVDTVTSPNGVWTRFCIFPLRRLPI